MAFSISILWKILLIAFSAIPVTIMANRLLGILMSQGFHSVVIAIAGVLVLLGYLLIIAFAINQSQSSSKNKISNWHFYAFSLFSVTSIIDFGIGLEQDGYISDFLGEYLKNGEPYLFGPFGTAICYFDGFGMFSLYLYMIYAISNNKSYRSAGIYWAGTIIFSMVVLFIGILWGKYGLFPSTALNIPYLIIPIAIVWSLLSKRPKMELSNVRQEGLHKKPLDLMLVIFLALCAIVTILRGAAVMENNISIANYYINKIEPFLLLNDPSPFLKIQILVYLFYFLPIYIISIYGLIQPGCTWMKDLTLFHAGAMAEGQYVLMTTAIHPNIPKSFQITDTAAQYIFWIVNIFILVVPHLLLAKCYFSNKFFCPQLLTKSVKSKEKSKHY